MSASELYTACTFYNCKGVKRLDDIKDVLRYLMTGRYKFFPGREVHKFDEKGNWISGKWTRIQTEQQIEEWSKRTGTYADCYYYNSPDDKRGTELPNERAMFKLFYLNEEKPFSSLNWHYFATVKYSEIDFGGVWIPRGNDSYIAMKLESLMQDLLILAKALYSKLKPTYGWIGKDVHTDNIRKQIQEYKKIKNICWANFFGSEYVDKFGNEFLLKAPGFKKERLLDSGIFYQVSPHFVIFDKSEAPPANEVKKHFEKHKQIKKVRYEPLYAESILSKRYLEKVIKAKNMSGRTDYQVTKKFSANDLRKQSENMVKRIRMNFGSNLDFKPESLKLVDEIISKYFDTNSMISNAVFIDFGSYLGEVIIRTLGGEWLPADNPMESEVVHITNIKSIKPMIKVEKRFANGLEDSLVIYYQEIEKYAKDKHSS